jgi:hypothetical protein
MPAHPFRICTEFHFTKACCREGMAAATSPDIVGGLALVAAIDADPGSISTYGIKVIRSEEVYKGIPFRRAALVAA